MHSQVVMKQLNTLENVEETILYIRGERVIIDSDLAKLYGVQTKTLNQAIKRNRHRFPEDFLFKLNDDEKHEVVTNCDHLIKLKYSNTLPYAFTEYGTIMAATVLNTDRAIHMSVFVVRAFVKLRKAMSVQTQLINKINKLEKKTVNHDVQIKALFDAVRQLISPSEKERRLIGFERRAKS